ncbi:MAG: NAD(P)-binding domain-containing protein, partial [Planctomycetes bacterium]|nr:NAD(P)-binding domain-containing protein [Planctomycetota bacterium]
MQNVQEHDYLIIGAGPAGLQLAYFLDRAGRDYLVLDGSDRPGTFFERFPRHRKFLSINKVYTGYEDRESQLRYDWNSLLCDDDEFNFTRYSKDYFPDAGDYARYLRDFASRFDLKIRFRTRIATIAREDGAGKFLVTDEAGRIYRSRVLIVATGLSKPYVPDIAGIEHAENYFDFSLDPEDYANQRVLILGKGNSAFETANHLTHVTRVTHLCSPHPIKLAWNTHFFGHLRAVNNAFLDTYILKGQNSVLDARVEKIERVDGEYHVTVEFTHAHGQRAVMAYDRVLCCTGFRWDPSFFREDCRPELSACGRLPAMTSAWESTNIRDLYFAGTVMQYRDLHKTMSNVLHGFRFNLLSLSRILACRYEAAPWPSRRLPLRPEAMADAIIRRVSSSAGLMHQPGFLCDVLVVDERQEAAHYHESLAVDYVRESEFGRLPHYYVVTMEYGHFNGATFNYE